MRSLLALIGAGVVFALAGFLYLGWDSDSTVSYKRVSETPISQAVIFSIPCGGSGPHLYVDRDGALEPVTLRLAEGLEDPEASKYAVSANKFVLEGYTVARLRDGKAMPGHYMDVTSWKPVPPYRFWRKSGDDIALEISDEPVEFGITGRSLAFRPHQDSGSAVC